MPPRFGDLVESPPFGDLVPSPPLGALDIIILLIPVATDGAVEMLGPSLGAMDKDGSADLEGLSLGDLEGLLLGESEDFLLPFAEAVAEKNKAANIRLSFMVVVVGSSFAVLCEM